MSLSKEIFYSEMTLPFGQNPIIAPSQHTHSIHAIYISCVKKQVLRSHGKIKPFKAYSETWSNRTMTFITGRPVFHNLLFFFFFHPLHQESFKPFFPPKSSSHEILIPHISDTLRPMF